MSPDEYASNKTDPPYTISVAKISLLAAYELASICGQTPNMTFKIIADALPLLYNSTLDLNQIAQEKYVPEPDAGAVWRRPWATDLQTCV